MRWSVEKPKPYVPPREGDVRITEKFLYLPITLPVGNRDGCLERRWWEKARIHQRCYQAADIDWHVHTWWADEYFTE